jgi:hypothetical protein
VHPKFPKAILRHINVLNDGFVLILLTGSENTENKLNWQNYKASEINCAINMLVLPSKLRRIHSFAGANSPGRTFGLPLSGFLDHTQLDTR